MSAISLSERGRDKRMRNVPRLIPGSDVSHKGIWIERKPRNADGINIFPELGSKCHKIPDAKIVTSDSVDGIGLYGVGR
jgi:hypothetical protein